MVAKPQVAQSADANLSAHKPSLALAAALPLLALSMLSGCFGLPPGSIHTGDEVSIRYTATNSATGEVVRSGQLANFIVGTGASGLGAELESALRGRLPNETFTADVGRDASRDYLGIVEYDRTLDPIPIVQVHLRADVERGLGTLTLGQTFAAYQIYTGQVMALDAQNVTIQITAQDGQRNPVTSLGATYVTHIEGDNLIVAMEPDVGATFPVYPASPPYYTPPAGLEPGSYRTEGMEGDELLYSYSPSTETELVGVPLTFEVTILTVVPGSAGAQPADGNYGVRDSPQVLGDPSSQDGRIFGRN